MKRRSSLVQNIKEQYYKIVKNLHGGTKQTMMICSDNINPSTWIPDSSIVDPYIPD